MKMKSANWMRWLVGDVVFNAEITTNVDCECSEGYGSTTYTWLYRQLPR